MMKENENGYAFMHAGMRIRPAAGFITELRSLIPPHAKKFLEWGAGCSTLLLQEIARARKGDLLTIDHTEEYLDSLSTRLDPIVTRWRLLDLTGPRRGQDDQEPNYASFPLALRETFDFILIDGRRRVECAVTALAVAAPGAVVTLHDYRRARYQTVSLLWDVTDGPQFRRLRKKHASTTNRGQS
jgi:predicted O-methyltransferase YrrM